MNSPLTTVEYEFENQLDLNHAFIPFIKNGGIFIPMLKMDLSLGDEVMLSVQLTGHTEFEQTKAKVVWITPDNAMHHIFSGIGFQLIGENAATVLEKIKSNLDNSVDTGGYVYGVSHDASV